jgi:hypothetical protein
MKLVIIFGPHAVGKMTVGQELEKISGFKLFHNHKPIELVIDYFSYSSVEGRQLVNRIRQEFFKAFAESDVSGYILTFVWAFEAEGERDYMEGIASTFEDKNATVYWIELEAPLEERLKRNVSANRLRHKPSKRDFAFSEASLIRGSEEHRLNSTPGEIPGPNYLRIDNTNVSARAAAEKIWSFINAE